MGLGDWGTVVHVFGVRVYKSSTPRLADCGAFKGGSRATWAVLCRFKVNRVGKGLLTL